MSSSGKTRRFDERLPQIRSAAAGIDVGGSEIWVDVGSRDPEPVLKFATFTADLHELADWLNHCGIDTVAMESTGVYWIPVCQILESKGDRGRAGECATRQECHGPQDRHVGLPMVADSA